MNPRKFLEFATAIANANSGPAENRRAISGAYYAAFNVVIEFLNQKARLEPTNQDKHRAVKLSLIESKDADVKQLGMKLDSLHTQRKKADYEMNSLHAEKRLAVMAACEIAQGIISALDGLEAANLENIVSGMQSWATNAQSGLRTL
jgi:uncharacterized protein (UPF0332 family)